MDGWQATKEALAAALEGISIEIDGPAAIWQAVAMVHTKPPTSIEPADLPCIVLGQSTLDDEWDSGGAFERYELTASLLLKDENAGRAVELTEHYRAQIKERIRRLPALRAGPALVTGGVSFTAVTDLIWNAQAYAGFQFTIPLGIEAAVEFGTGF